MNYFFISAHFQYGDLGPYLFLVIFLVLFKFQIFSLSSPQSCFSLFFIFYFLTAFGALWVPTCTLGIKQNKTKQNWSPNRWTTREFHLSLLLIEGLSVRTLEFLYVSCFSHLHSLYSSKLKSLHFGQRQSFCIGSWSFSHGPFSP